MQRVRANEATYLRAYADMLWREHASAIRAADQTGDLHSWLRPISEAFAMTDSEAGVLCGYLSDKLRDEAVVRDAPPSDPLFR